MTKLTTEGVRRAWHPPKSDKGAAFIEAYRALDAILKAWKFDGGKGDTGAYNPRPITGGTDWSLHAYGPGDEFTFWYGAKVTTACAVDIDWTNNPYGPTLVTNMPRAMVEAIKAIRTISGDQVWGWGGDYGGNKDAMHFEIVCTPAQLRTGINWATVAAAGAPTPPVRPTPVPERAPADFVPEDTMKVVTLRYDAPRPAESWLLVGPVGPKPNCAVNLNLTTGEVPALVAAVGEGVVNGTRPCDLVKSFWNEVKFADLHR